MSPDDSYDGTLSNDDDDDDEDDDDNVDVLCTFNKFEFVAVQDGIDDNDGVGDVGMIGD